MGRNERPGPALIALREGYRSIHSLHPATMPQRKTQPIRRKVRNWTAADSAELYCVPDWGNDFFGVSRNGETTVRLIDSNDEPRHVSLASLMKELSERGTEAPILLRFRDLLRARLDELNRSFSNAIRKLGSIPYQGKPAEAYRRRNSFVRRALPLRIGSRFQT